MAERIHHGDIVDVDVVGNLEFDWRGGLTPEGYLDGLEKASKQIFALCRTESELAEAIKRDYQNILRSPTVVVTIVDRSNRALAFMHGAVRQPQRFQLRRPATLAELIVLSGGITDRSSGRIVIFRPPNVSCDANFGQPSEQEAGTAPNRISIGIGDLVAGSPEANPVILSGDIVLVEENHPIFVINDSSVRLRFNLTPNLTLSHALEAAIGPVATRKVDRVRVYRRKGDNRMLEFDLGKIVKHPDSDPKLEPYDVIEIFGKRSPPRRIQETDESRTPLSETLRTLPLRIVD